MYAKLISNTIRPAPKQVNYNGNIIFNPPDSILSELGYLPVTYIDMPDNAPEGKHYEPHWEQTDTEILQVWTLGDDSVYPEPEPTMSDLMDAIERGLTT